MAESHYMSALISKGISADEKLERVKLPIRVYCEHVSTMCVQCADSWAIDYILEPHRTKWGRELLNKINALYPTKPMMAWGEIAWRKDRYFS